jgi:aldose 1-epimerase
MSLTLHKNFFGISPKGEDVVLFTLSLADSITVKVMNYGATLTHLFVPDRIGDMGDVVLGFDTFEGYIQEDYLSNYCYLGATIGRVAGRITDNKFELEGKHYELPANQGDIHLHGGIEGWDKKIWEAEEVGKEGAIGVKFSYTSRDMEEQYPGNLQVNVTYWLKEDGTLELSYTATTDQTTVLNPTNHSYFNLSGDFSKSIEDHLFYVNAGHYLPMNLESLPTGEMLSVTGTPFDFGRTVAIESNISKSHPQVEIAGGIDHCFVLKEGKPAATLYHPGSGRKLTLNTSEPGVQVYTSNYLNKSFVGKNGIAFDKRSAICLETQHFPDSCNNPGFPKIELRPEAEFKSTTTFKFSVA